MFFVFYSKWMWIPVTFKPVMLGGDGGQMESGSISIWRRIGFKMTQLLLTGNTLFVSYRTLEYVKCGDAGFFGERSNEKLGLDWDFVPMMFMMMVYYVTWDAVAYFLYDAQRGLNTKVFNEFIRLRGKTNPLIIQLVEETEWTLIPFQDFYMDRN